MLHPTTLLVWLTLGQATATPAPAPTPPPQDSPAPVVETFRPDPAWKPLGQDLWFDPQGRRVVLRARVCQTDATLEHFMCLKGTKEHESILATEAPPKSIHAGLILTGANPGHPVQFEPAFDPPAGTSIAIEVEWNQVGQPQKADARSWVKEEKSGKPLDRDWVFAGSVLYLDRRTQKMAYAADDGDLITVANFASSILDLPYRSSASDADRTYMANPDKIPPRGTPVTVSLKPRLAAPDAPLPKP